LIHEYQVLNIARVSFLGQVPISAVALAIPKKKLYFLFQWLDFLHMGLRIIFYSLQILLIGELLYA